MSEIFTIGHGTRGLDEFVNVLKDAGVEVLMDVRRHPGSRRHPHFSRDALATSLPAVGIAYEWWGEPLGGRRNPNAEHDRHFALRNASFRAYASHMETPEFRDALGALEERSDKARLAVMCAETLWWRCHRRLIADALLVDGHEVAHLGIGSNKPHVLTQAARVDDSGVLIYDVELAD